MDHQLDPLPSTYHDIFIASDNLLCAEILYSPRPGAAQNASVNKPIIWIKAGVLHIILQSMHFNNTRVAYVEYHDISCNKIDLIKSSAKWGPFSLGRRLLTLIVVYTMPIKAEEYIVTMDA